MSEEFIIECPICPTKYTASDWKADLSSYCMLCGTELYNAINIHIPGASPKLEDHQLLYVRDSDGEVVRTFTANDIQAAASHCVTERLARSGHTDPPAAPAATACVDPVN